MDTLPDGSWDKSAGDRVEALKTKLRARLGANVVEAFETSWDGQGLTEGHIGAPASADGASAGRAVVDDASAGRASVHDASGGHASVDDVDPTEGIFASIRRPKIPLASFTGDCLFTAVAIFTDGRSVAAGDKLGRVHVFELRIHDP